LGERDSEKIYLFVSLWLTSLYIGTDNSNNYTY